MANVLGLGGLAAGGLMVLLTPVIKVVIALIIGLIVIKAVLGIAEKGLQKSTLDGAMHKFALTAIKWALYVLLLVIIVGSIGIPTAPIVTVIGACGAAIALALQGSLSSIASGIIILVQKPFKQGDEIEVGGKTGLVESIDVMVTTLKTVTNEVICIPNSVITSSVVVNRSRETTRREDLVYSISYSSDISKAREVLLQVAASCPEILRDPEPCVGVSAHGGSAIELNLRFWVPTDQFYAIQPVVNEKVKAAFDEAGISIPFPQMDVHVIQ